MEEEPTPENIDRLASELAERDPQMASRIKGLSRMTISATMIEGGIKSNSIPSKCMITCDVRTLYHQDEAYLRGELDKILAGIPDVDYDIDYMAIPSMAPLQHRVCGQGEGCDGAVAGRIGGGVDTDVHDGIHGLPVHEAAGDVDVPGSRCRTRRTSGNLANVHGTNESVDVRSLILGYEDADSAGRGRARIAGMITVLAGGVGAARFLQGLVKVVEPGRQSRSSSTRATT